MRCFAQLHSGVEQTLMFSAFPNHSVHSLCSNPQLKARLYSVMIGKNKDAIAILYLNFQPVVLPNKAKPGWGKSSNDQLSTYTRVIYGI